MGTAITIIEPDNTTRTTNEDEGFGSLETAKGHLPLRSIDVETKVAGLVARTTLKQVFVNTYKEPLEATYIFPLPPRAAVSHFELRVAGRAVVGELQERGQARATYNAAIASGHRAAIAEEERPDVFTMRVGNLPPGEEAEVELVLTAPLEVIAGEVTYRFPLVVAPRYMPGVPLGGEDVGSGIAPDTDAVPDASRISPPVMLPNYPNPVQLSLSVDIDTGGLALENLRSTLHSVLVESSRERAHIQVQPGERVNRDFILRWDVSSDTIGTACLASPSPKNGAPSVFQLTLVPPADVARAQRPRDVVFVLDRSGSMSGWKMVAARRALGRILDTLSPQDRFNVLSFDDRIEPLPGHAASALVDATNRNRYRAIEHLSGVDARGGTEMAQPLRQAADALSGGYQDRDRWIVLVTDGQVGNEDQILRDLGSRIKNVRIFTVGIDRAVNEGFLRRLSELGGGGTELVESEDRLDEVMDRVHRAIDSPVLTELSIELEGGDIDATEIVPGRVAGLFAGAPLILSGRIRGALDKDATLIVRGANTLGDSWSTRVPVQQVENEAVGVLWARQRLRELEDRYTIGRGSTSDIEKEIIKVSLDYNVLCRFTAFVAVDKAEVIENHEDMREVTQPVESVEGWEGGALVGDFEEDDDAIDGLVAGNRGAFARQDAEAPKRARKKFKAKESRAHRSQMKLEEEREIEMPAFEPEPEATRSISFDSQMVGGFDSFADFEFADEPTSTSTPRSYSTSSYNAPAPQALGGMMPTQGAGGGAPGAPAPSAPARPMPTGGRATGAASGQRPGNRVSQTQAGAIKGSIRDFSPEQVKALPPMLATDVWSVATVLYQLLHGSALFTGSSDFELLSKIIKAELPEQLVPTTVSPKLELILSAALKAAPEDRPMMHTLAGELEALVDDRDAALAEIAKLIPAIDANKLDRNAPSPELDDARFEFIGLFAHTGSHDIWLAKDTTRDVNVVIRVLHAHIASDPERVVMFMNVVSTALDGTPTLIASGHVADDGSGGVVRPYVVLEYAEGVDLQHILREHGALEPQAAIYIMARVARILSDCHALILPDGSHGLLHGEVKPGHIVVSKDGEVSLLDFGAGVDLSGAKKKARARESYNWASGAVIESPIGPKPEAPEQPKKGLFGKIATMLRGESKTEDKPTDEKSSGRRDFWK